MSGQELKPLPKGLLKTVAYTQLCEAIKKDFGIELPMKSGKGTTRAVEEMLGVRTPDPILEELADALGKLLFECDDITNTCKPTRTTYNHGFAVLQKYQQSKVQL